MKMFATLLFLFPLGVFGVPLGLLGSGSERRELLQEKVCYYQVPLDDRVEEKYYQLHMMVMMVLAKRKLAIISTTIRPDNHSDGEDIDE